MTSTVRSAIVATRQVLRSHSVRKMLIRSEAPDIRLIRIDASWQAIEDPQHTENSEEVLEAHPFSSSFEAAQRVAGHTRPVGKLCLRQAPQLSPTGHRLADLVH